LIVVSHDRDFLDQIATKIIAFEGNGEIDGMIGGYSDYLAYKKSQEKEAQKTVADKAPKAETRSDAPKKPVKLTYKLKYELENLPSRIAGLKTEIDNLEQSLADPGLYEQDAHGYQRYSERLVIAKQELDADELRLVELEEMAAGLR